MLEGLKAIAISFLVSISVVSLTEHGINTWDKNSSIESVNRSIKVYSTEGKLIKEYKGKVDVGDKGIVVNNAVVIAEEE